jgi:sugar transferase (PEP-CTERM/EpsH1 system associated)
VRILFLSHRFPYPPNDGAKIRAYHIVDHLARGNEVTVAAPLRSARERDESRGIEGRCARVIAEEITPGAARLRMVGNLLTRAPSSMGYFRSPALERRIREELAARPYDLIFAYCSSIAPYVAGARGPRKILDFVDMDSQKWLAYAKVHRFPLSLGYRLEGTKLRRAEAELARHFDLCTCATPAETATFEGYATGVEADWFPNGVDIDRFAPATEPYDPDSICFVGRMDYYPNARCMVEFCAETLPLIRARRPATKLAIVGAEPLPSVRRLAAIPGVTVTGSVPDVRPHVRKAALTVAPLAIARGTQNKILESLAMGVPCVCSDLAAGGVDAVAGEHLLAASTPEGYAAAILRILGDPGERRRLAEAGRARMLSHHTWESAMRRLDAILERTLATAAGERR